MAKLMRATWAALLGLAVCSPAALAEKASPAPSAGHMRVKDDGGVFSPTLVAKAEAQFEGVTFKSPTYLTVRTFGKLPADKKADFDKLAKDDKTGRRTFHHEWATALAKGENDRGVFVLVCMESHGITVIADKQTDLYRHFTDKNADEVYDILKGGFEDAAKLKDKSEDDKRVVRGEALVKATDYVVTKLKNTSAPETKTTGATHSTDPVKKSTGMGIGGWICLGLCVLLGVWVMIALIRALTGGGGGGYGGGGMGGGYGGGGGGFFSSFIGGMFGAAAGMWMYNSFFGGNHMSNDMSAGESYGNSGTDGNTDTGAGDYDNGASGGGDWNDDAGGDTGGGGDAGGGGDWGDTGGGGGDTGGGGDWGGGGGDFGGGGGDW